jgi:hypothetical protein
VKAFQLGRPRFALTACVFLAGAGVSAAAQDEPWERTLDVLGGETLYEDGWLFTLGYSATRKAGLLHRDDRAGDPTHRSEFEQALSLAAHYGLLHDVQLGVLLPYVWTSVHQETTGVPPRLAASGLGDAAFFGKWAFFENYEPHMNLKASLIGGLEVPTGASRESDHGVRLPPDLQPGSGSWDPFLGAALNYEPNRWKFDATVLYKRNGENAGHYHLGDELYVELAAGNRFYLEPYPGPFMRFDLELIYRHFDRDRLGGSVIDSSGRDLLSVGGRYVFRPRPSIDTQIEVEVPVYQRVGGIQLAEKFSVFLVFAIRI